DKLYPSSSSSTQIFDDPNIPALKALRVVDQTKQIMPVDFAEPRAGTLENLLFLWLLFAKCRSTILGCGMAGTSPCVAGKIVRKELAESLRDGDVMPARKQYRLELGISDGTSYVVVVMFDETTSEFVKAQPTHLRKPTKRHELKDSDADSLLVRAEENKKQCVSKSE
ncbi:hypothetical protein Tco_0840839, partial [Tanacetum coccineum]